MPPLIVDPALQAAVVRQFNLRGELAPFTLTEQVIPIFDIGQLVGAAPTVVTTTVDLQGVRVGTLTAASDGKQALATQIPFSEDNQVVDGGFTVNPGAAAVICDSGALAASNRTFDIYANGNAIYDVIVEWRDAANAVTLASWSLLVGGVGVGNMVHWGPHNLNIALNERIRLVTGGAVVGTLSGALSFTTNSASLAA